MFESHCKALKTKRTCQQPELTSSFATADFRAVCMCHTLNFLVLAQGERGFGVEGPFSTPRDPYLTYTNFRTSQLRFCLIDFDDFCRVTSPRPVLHVQKISLKNMKQEGRTGHKCHRMSERLDRSVHRATPI